MIRIALFFLLIANALTAQGQGQTNIWYFGVNAGVDFNSGVPVPLLDGALVTAEGCATMCDSLGNLLFYTDGIRAYDRNHQQMPNGFGMTGDPSSAQSGLIVPKPGNSKRYYLFTVAGQGDPAGFGYSEVDMTLNGGLGDVVAATKNTQLHTPSCEKVAAVKHANGLYTWVISHAMYTNRYYAYLLDCDGLRPPITTNVGQVEGWPGWGYLSASPDGKKLGSAMRSQGFELLDFDPATGVISNPILLSNVDECYGISFSPDNNLLYGLRITGGAMYQWNTQAGGPAAIIASIVSLGNIAGISAYRGGAIQQASDGKLYIPHYTEPFLGVIHSPNTIGAACNFQNYAVDLLGRGARLGLPPFVQGFLDTAEVIDLSAACYGATTSFTVNGDATYLDSVRWDFGDPASGPLNTSTLLAPSHSYPASGSYTVTLIRHIDCISDTTVQEINVTAPTVTTVDTAICSLQTYTLPGGGTVTEAGSYTDTIPTAIGCDSIVVTNLTVNPLPQLTVIPDTTICVGNALQLIASGANAYLWTPATNLSNDAIASPQFTGTSTITYTLVGSTLAGCEAILQTTVTVNQLPNVSAGPDAIICLNIPHQMQATGAAQYAWSPAAGLSNAAISNPQFTGNATTTYTVTGTDANGCVNTAQKTINVNPLPTINAGSDVAICIGATTQLGASGAANLQWAPATGLDDATIANPTFSGLATQTFTVTGTDANGCQHTDDVTITVVNLPPVDAGNDTAICIGNTLQLNASGAVGYAWNPAADLTNAAIGNPVFSGIQTATLTVTGTDAAGCVNTADITITVHPLPVVDAGTDAAICAAQSEPLQASGAQNYVWSPATGLSDATLASPIFGGATTTTFTATGTDSNGCINTDDVTVTVFPLPVAVINPPQEVCLNNATVLTHSATGGITDYLWTLEPGVSSTAQAIFHTYTSAGDFEVILIVNDTNGCVHSDTALATVLPLPQPDMNLQNNTDFCEQELIQCTALNADNMAAYAWNFNYQPGLPATPGFSSSQQNPTFAYSQFGVYNVRLLVLDQNGCTGSVVRTINVNDVPVADFSFNVACEGQSTLFTSLSTVEGTIPISGWQWNLGDGSAVQSGPSYVHTYAAAGTYPAELIVATIKGCRDTLVQNVWVNPSPVIVFSGNNACLDDETVFVNASSPQDATIALWEWNFGDGQTLQGANATHTYAAFGTYNVTLAATTDSACVTTGAIPIAIYPNPEPALTILMPEGCEPLPVPLVSTSTIAAGSIATHQWDFGDGNNATGASLIHVYQDTIGVFDITLTVASNEGCTTVLVQVDAVTVNVTPVANFSQNETVLSMLNPLLVLTDLSQDALIYNWTFGEGTTSAVASPTHRYNQPGEYIITLLVRNGDCTGTKQSSVIVEPLFTFYIPDAFTPNSNGRNDRFFGQGEGYASYTMTIFDRWGEVIFYGVDALGGWDGTYKGAAVPNGAYVYHITVTDWTNEQHDYTGKVMLVR